jgi:hypothetical protein
LSPITALHQSLACAQLNPDVSLNEIHSENQEPPFAIARDSNATAYQYFQLTP